MSQASPVRVHVRISGSGLNVLPHTGIATIVRHWRSFGHVVEFDRIDASSSGCLSGLILACFPSDPDDRWATSVAFLRKKYEQHRLVETHDIIRQFFRECLPGDAHRLATDRLHVYFTTISPCGGIRSTVQSTFTSNEDLLGAVLKSTSLPGITCTWPLVDSGKVFFDGCQLMPHRPDPGRVGLYAGPNDLSAVFWMCGTSQFRIPGLQEMPDTRVPPPGTVVRTYVPSRVIQFILALYTYRFQLLLALGMYVLRARAWI